MNLQQWALVIAVAVVLLFILGMVILTIRQADRARDGASSRNGKYRTFSCFQDLESLVAAALIANPVQL